MADTDKPLLIKRYASRRLYNTETSDYVTLEDIAGFIRAGREVQIVDLKTGDLVWLNADAAMGGDVRDPDGAQKRVGQLLEAFPGSVAPTVKP